MAQSNDPRERLLRAERELLDAIYVAELHHEQNAELLSLSEKAKAGDDAAMRKLQDMSVVTLLEVATEGLRLSADVKAAKRRYFDMRNTIESILGKAERVGTREP